MKLIITDLETLPCRVDGEYKLIGPGRPFRHCVGCFGCWIKTPGVCVIHDGCELTGRDLSKCSELILVSRCVYGCTSPFVKNVLDRAISYIHPYFAVRGGEMHHRRRYENRLTSRHISTARISPRLSGPRQRGLCRQTRSTMTAARGR